MGGSVPVREFASVEEMRAHYAAIRQRCFSPPVPRLAAPALSLALPKRIWAAPSIVPRERVALRTAAQVSGRAKVSLFDCLRTTSRVTDISLEHICGPRRRPPLAKARQIASWLAHHHAGTSCHQIAARLGKRDHTSVLHGMKRVQAVIDAGLVAPSDDLEETARALWVAEWPQAGGTRRAENGRFVSQESAA